MSLGEIVTPGTLSVLPQPVVVDKRPLNRLDLAGWVVSDQNPLTARVTVNRAWQHLFGRGLVASSDDDDYTRLGSVLDEIVKSTRNTVDSKRQVDHRELLALPLDDVVDGPFNPRQDD